MIPQRLWFFDPPHKWDLELSDPPQNKVSELSDPPTDSEDPRLP